MLQSWNISLIHADRHNKPCTYQPPNHICPIGAASCLLFCTHISVVELTLTCTIICERKSPLSRYNYTRFTSNLSAHPNTHIKTYMYICMYVQWFILILIAYSCPVLNHVIIEFFFHRSSTSSPDHHLFTLEDSEVSSSDLGGFTCARTCCNSTHVNPFYFVFTQTLYVDDWCASLR
jgi:hypothetical protein